MILIKDINRGVLDELGKMMMKNKRQERIIHELIKYGKNFLESPKKYNSFSKIKEADNLLNDIKMTPHFFVLACVMDRQIKAERAWLIPYKVSQIIGNISFNSFAGLSNRKIERIFLENKLHRFNKVMSKNFYKAIQRIKNQYGGDASRIWQGRPNSASIVRKFLEFEGIGLKIATMATNILAREFKIKFSDYSSIDISTDVHIIRMFKKLGLAPKNASREYIIYRAREIYPEYPGILDISLFKISRGDIKELWK